MNLDLFIFQNVFSPFKMIPKCRKQTDTHAHTVRAGLNPLPTGSEAVYIHAWSYGHSQGWI